MGTDITVLPETLERSWDRPCYRRNTVYLVDTSAVFVSRAAASVVVVVVLVLVCE